jgi:hypothetical protein
MPMRIKQHDRSHIVEFGATMQAGPPSRARTWARAETENNADVM